jgi:hypothetical protein
MLVDSVNSNSLRSPYFTESGLTLPQHRGGDGLGVWLTRTLTN